MFESLSQRLSSTVERLRGRGRLTEANIRESMREVRIALLEADVALPCDRAGGHEEPDARPGADQGRA